MKIYDKASWQIDNGMDISTVLKHFDVIFKCLDEKGFLNGEGKEVLGLGIDESISLNDRMLTDKGIEFMDQYYDKIIAESKYDTNIEVELLKAILTI